MTEKPYKHLCSFVDKDGVLCCKYLTELGVGSFPKQMELGTNQRNYSDEDLASINTELELFKVGKLSEPNCDTCKHKFICWTQR